MVLHIPKEGRKSLADLLKASPEFLDALYNALKDSEPRLLSGDTSQLRPKLSGFPEGDAKALTEFVRLINGALNASDDGAPPEKIVADLLAAAQTGSDKDLSARAPGWGKVRDFLTKVFGIDKLRTSARAFSLYYDNARHLHVVRILTDARPIFSKGADADPAGFVIMHTMRLTYGEDATTKDWYISLDSDDLQELKKAAERAISKQKSLNRFLKKNTSVFTPYEVVDEAAASKTN